jgi:[protein-PII] uridylyltransferase
LAPVQEDPWYEDLVRALPASLLLAHPAEETASILKRLRDLASSGADAWGTYLADSRTCEYVIGVGKEVSHGVFHRLAGALTGQGMRILSAEINTLRGGLILDRFVVQDPDYAGQPTAERFAVVSRALVASVSNTDPPKFRRVFGQSDGQAAPLSHLQNEVRIDNSTSTACTIIDVFTFDRIGLLYKVTRLLFEMGLSVSVAKIGTYLDQVVDVFYVTDQAGAKINDEARLQEIRARLLEAIGAP